MRRVYRGMQAIGLLLPPIVISLQLLGSPLRGYHLLAILAAAVCLFWMGRILEGYAAR